MRSRSALTASVGVHAAFIAALLWLSGGSDPPPQAALVWTEVELLNALPSRQETPDAVELSPLRAQPRAAANQDAFKGVEDAPPSEPPPRPAANKRKRSRGPVGAPPVTDNPSGDSPTDGRSADSGGVALLGLRDAVSGESPSGAAFAPRLPAGTPTARDARRAGTMADSGEARTPAQAGFKRARDGRLVFRDPDPKAAWSAELLPDGRIKFNDHLRESLPERLMARRGIRFWLKRKKRLLASTYSMRLNMAVDFAEKNIDRQLARLYRDLWTIWESNRPPRTRRGLLFDVWDDCEESLVVNLGEFADREQGKVDAMRRAAGVQARRKIVAFVARHLPAGSADAYPKAELTALNDRRVSRERFVPYSGV